MVEHESVAKEPKPGSVVRWLHLTDTHFGAALALHYPERNDFVTQRKEVASSGTVLISDPKITQGAWDSVATSGRVAHCQDQDSVSFFWQY